MRYAGDSYDAIRDRRQLAIEKTLTMLRLPSGVSVGEMAAIWEAMNFGTETDLTPFDPKRFGKATENIRALRKVSRKGRALLQLEAEHYADEPKIVVGEPYDEEALRRRPAPLTQAAISEALEPPAPEVAKEGTPLLAVHQLGHSPNVL